MSRAAVAFPARGSYGPASLGSLPPAHPWVRRADQLRREAGLPPLSDLDRAPGFDPAVHLPAPSSPMTFLCACSTRNASTGARGGRRRGQLERWYTA